MRFLSFIPIAGILAGIVAFFLLFILIRRVKKRKKGISAYLTNIISIILFGLLSSTLLLMFGSFKNYEHFSYKKTVLSVVCHAKEDNWFVLEIIPEDTKEEKNQFYRLKGQQFLLEGHIVKWKDFLSFMGMKPLYQVARISGRYVDLEDEKNKKRSVYEINKTSRFWEFMMRHGRLVPGVDAVYGTASFTYPRINDTLQLKITHSGFMID
ncbi:hypothetical protein KAW48_10755 [candidate division WOR-3 bacterium]|nr:hypothetical protein [candidate division WOR-3 bacterium]